MAIRVRAQGIVFRNPRPELRAVHAWHPSLVGLGGGRWLCSFDLASAPEALDYATYLSWSEDDGASWTPAARMFDEGGPRRATHSVRVSRLRDGRLIGAGARLFRDDPDRGLINRPSLGYTPMELMLLRSEDEGRSWSAPARVAPPLEGPCFETCHPLLELNDGRLVWPTSTWMGWGGEAPNGMKAIALVSEDGGDHWLRSVDIFDRWTERVLHWEVSVVQLADGRLLAVAWALDTRDGASGPTPYALSDDALSFTVRGRTGLCAQTAKLLALPDGRAVCAFRRHDQPGLWAAVVELHGAAWKSAAPSPLGQGAASGMEGGSDRVGEQLSALAFGYPSLQLRPDGDVMVAFWCRDDCIGGIRWLRLALE